MQLVPAMDSVYLWGEGGNSPCHVIALQLFRPPEGSGAELVDELYEAMTDPVHVKRSFRRRPAMSARSKRPRRPLAPNRRMASRTARPGP